MDDCGNGADEENCGESWAQLHTDATPCEPPKTVGGSDANGDEKGEKGIWYSIGNAIGTQLIASRWICDNYQNFHILRLLKSEVQYYKKLYLMKK